MTFHVVFKKAAWFWEIVH